MSATRPHRPNWVYLTATPITDGDGWGWDSYVDRREALRAIRRLRSEDARIGDGKKSMLYKVATTGMKSITVPMTSEGGDRG